MGAISYPLSLNYVFLCMIYVVLTKDKGRVNLTGKEERNGRERKIGQMSLILHILENSFNLDFSDLLPPPFHTLNIRPCSGE